VIHAYESGEACAFSSQFTDRTRSEARDIQTAVIISFCHTIAVGAVSATLECRLGANINTLLSELIDVFTTNTDSCPAIFANLIRRQFTPCKEMISLIADMELEPTSLDFNSSLKHGLQSSCAIRSCTCRTGNAFEPDCVLIDLTAIGILDILKCECAISPSDRTFDRLTGRTNPNTELRLGERADKYLLVFSGIAPCVALSASYSRLDEILCLLEQMALIQSPELENTSRLCGVSELEACEFNVRQRERCRLGLERCCIFGIHRDLLL
jgi:hypothetical protein